MRRRIPVLLGLILLFFAGMLVRIIAIANIPYGFDIGNFHDTALIVARGGNIYSEQYWYNYTPFIAQFCRLLLGSRLGYIPTHQIVISAWDFLNALLIGLLLAQQGRRRLGWIVLMVYWLNPLVMIIEITMGQFDLVALTPLLLAVYWSGRGYRGVGLWLLCLLSIFIKHVFLFQVWALFVWWWSGRKAALRMSAIGALFLLSFAPYLPDGAPRIIERVLLYTSASGNWGLSMFLSERILVFAMAISLIALPFVARPRSFVYGLVSTTLIYYAVSAGVSANALITLLALSLIVVRWYEYLLICVAFLFLQIPSVFSWDLWEWRGFWVPIWLVCIYLTWRYVGELNITTYVSSRFKRKLWSGSRQIGEPRNPPIK